MNQRGAVSYWYFIGMVILAVVLVTFFQALRQKAPTAESMALRVHKSGRYLERVDGRPFFWNGEVESGLESPDPVAYLRSKQDAGVSVIVGPWLFREGDSLENPFPEKDPRKPSEAWFKKFDAAVKKAEEMGMYIAPVVLDSEASRLSVESAKSLGRWLGERYRERQNMVWIAGAGYDLAGQSSYKIYNALAEGLREGGGWQVIGIIPHQSGSSGTFWQNIEWLGFNVCHKPPHSALAAWTLVEMDYMRSPSKPSLLLLPESGEPGAAADLEWRKEAYRSVLAGAVGVVSEPGGNIRQRAHLRRLMESRPPLQRVPDNRLLEVEPSVREGERCQAAGDIMGSYAMIYVPDSPRKFTVRLDRLFARKIKAWWFNPGDGSAKVAGEFEKLETTEFKSPAGRMDWVLVLDDAVKNYPPPGQAYDPSRPAAAAGAARN